MIFKEKIAKFGNELNKTLLGRRNDDFNFLLDNDTFQRLIGKNTIRNLFPDMWGKGFGCYGIDVLNEGNTDSLLDEANRFLALPVAILYLSSDKGYVDRNDLLGEYVLGSFDEDEIRIMFINEWGKGVEVTGSSNYCE